MASFFMRSQDLGGTVDQHVTAIRILARMCEFGTLNDSYQGPCSMTNSRLMERLLRIHDLDLSKAVDTCCVAESSQDQLRAIE